jgi:low affinity Fe/Cu permease
MRRSDKPPLRKKVRRPIDGNGHHSAILPKARPNADHAPIRDVFHHFAQRASHLVGSAWAFVVAAVVIAVWAITGPLFGYSDTWQLVINTGTTIVTFLMVFLIQNTQNRDARALHLKLDELLRAMTKARTGLVDLEDLAEDELDRLEQEFKSVRDRAVSECAKL